MTPDRALDATLLGVGEAACELAEHAAGITAVAVHGCAATEPLRRLAWAHAQLAEVRCRAVMYARHAGTPWADIAAALHGSDTDTVEAIWGPWYDRWAAGEPAPWLPQIPGYTVSGTPTPAKTGPQRRRRADLMRWLTRHGHRGAGQTTAAGDDEDRGVAS